MIDLQSQTLSLDAIRELAGSGAADLAVLEGIRSYARPDISSYDRLALLNDLAVLRHLAGDARGALRILRRAAAEWPDAPLVRENLRALETLPGAVDHEAICDPREVNSGAENPWVLDGLKELDRVADLDGLSVVELGGSTPASALSRFSPRQWTSVDLRPVASPATNQQLVGGDASRLPFKGDSFDAAFSICAFEHFDDVSGVLRDVFRVLRPGGLLFTQFSPIWSCALGHHLWICDDEAVVTFNDGVVPDWAHLVLEESELRTYLELVLDEKIAERSATFIYHSRYLNRRSEGELQRAFEDSGFELEASETWGGEKVPSAALTETLQRHCPAGGDFSRYGLRLSLRKPG